VVRQDMGLKSRHFLPAMKRFEGMFFAKVSTLTGSSKNWYNRPITPKLLKGLRCVYVHYGIGQGIRNTGAQETLTKKVKNIR
jgi:hypothetical protein